SALHRAAAQAGLPTVAEAFADRAYTAAGTLVPRGTPGAVIADEETVVTRSVGIARDNEVVALTGERIAVRARSLCVHGDTPGAAALARRLRAALEQSSVRVAPFS